MIICMVTILYNKLRTSGRFEASIKMTKSKTSATANLSSSITVIHEQYTTCGLHTYHKKEKKREIKVNLRWQLIFS